MRGKGSYAPFLPGGLEATVKTEWDADGEQDAEEEDEEESGWKTRAPGLPRGIKLEGGGLFSRICYARPLT